MCELLINIGDRQNGSDLSWRNGDVVIAMPDGHIWGRFEHKPTFLASGGLEADWPNKFAVVKVPDMTVEEATGLMDVSPLDVNGLPTRRSGFRIQQNLIAPDRLALGQSLGELISSRAAVLAIREVM